jgi:hypothetical protein
MKVLRAALVPDDVPVLVQASPNEANATTQGRANRMERRMV